MNFFQIFPTEIIFKILEHITVKDLIIFTTLSKNIRKLLLSDLYIWKIVIKNNITTLDSFFDKINNINDLFKKLMYYDKFINMKFLNINQINDINYNVNNLILDLQKKYNYNFKSNIDLINLFVNNLQHKLVYSTNNEDIQHLYNLSIEYGFDIIVENMFYMSTNSNNLNIIEPNQRIKNLLHLKHNKLIKFLLNKYIFNLRDSNFILRWSAKYGNIEIFTFLLDNFNVRPEHFNNITLHWAIEENNFDIVKILLKYPNVDITSKNNFPLYLSVKNNNFEITKFILQNLNVNPSDKNNRTLNIAIENNNIDIVKLLIYDKRITLDNNISSSIIYAFKNNYDDICNLIFNDKRIDHINLIKFILQNY
jgi:hypothetical protein